MEEHLKDNLEQKGQEAKEKATSFLEGVRSFLLELIDIRTGTNEKGTIEVIRDNISMKGHTAWILVFSIFVASIGLNANSTAVVIGAMLISPLMGPILGVGLSIGINDIYMLKRSLINLGVMVGLSLLTSFLFYSLPFAQDSTSELLARTRPDVRDVLIALSGGLALIVAISRPSPQTNTVAGVAIATALMPPLCTAGYGLASGEYKYFFGALFLFLINCIFIALATFMIVKFLRFKMVRYLNSARRKRISRIASIVATIILAGSVFSFYNLILENRFRQSAHEFIEELKNQGVAILGDDSKNINYETRTITLPLLGSMVSKEKIANWNGRIVELGLEDVTLNVQQKDDSEIRSQVQNLQELYAQNQKIISSRDESLREKEDRIRLLESQLSTFYKNSIPFKDVSEEAAINYTNLKSMSYYKQINTDFKKLDSIAVFEVMWKKNTKANQKIVYQKQLGSWLKKRLNLDTLKIVERK